MAPASRAIAMASLLGLAGCATGRPPAPAAEPPLAGTPAVRAEEFIAAGWAFELGETRQQIVRNLGEPAAADTEAVVNRHRPELTDTIYTLRYDGLTARVYDVTASGKQIVTHLTLTGPRYDAKWDLGVGTSVDRVTRVLGEPTARLQGQLLYEGGEPATQSVVFFLEEGSVSKIEWRFYID